MKSSECDLERHVWEAHTWGLSWGGGNSKDCVVSKLLRCFLTQGLVSSPSTCQPVFFLKAKDIRWSHICGFPAMRVV